MTEGGFKKDLIIEIKRMLKDCIILKNDPTFIQGIPDLLILYKNRWAALEVKKTKHSPIRPNQEYYIDKMDIMAFACFVYPENMEEVLNELYQYFMEKR